VIVLDTNVLSEIMRAKPDPVVLDWLDAQQPDDLWLNSVVAAELLFGVARLPEGARKQQLALAVSAMLEQDFAAQILSFDLSAASVYAVMLAERARIGASMAKADAQIAAICLSRDATLATRNTRHFEGVGLSLMNPWDSPMSPTVN
jgi:predicted nucleic acid-binding protein